MPESPRWQYSKGMQVESAEGAVQLWGPTGPDQLSEGAPPPARPQLAPLLSHRPPARSLNSLTCVQCVHALWVEEKRANCSSHQDPTYTQHLLAVALPSSDFSPAFPESRL